MEITAGAHSKGNNEWDEILSADYCYLPWSVFDDKYDHFPPRQELQHVLRPFSRKKKVVFITRRTPGQSSIDSWDYVKQRARSLSQHFDGFFLPQSCSYDETCLGQEGENRTRQIQSLPLFIRKCYVLLVDPFDVYKDRFFILWTAMLAAKNRRLIVSDNVKPLLKLISTNPTYESVLTLLKDAKVLQRDEPEKQRLLMQLKDHFMGGAHYSLIPVSNLLSQTKWESIHAVPLLPTQVNPARVLMVSHRWQTEQHPDPDNHKLKLIQTYLCEAGQDLYDYVFFDLVCVDQQKDISTSLVAVDELYAKSHCLCICEGDYFERSWCLFEIAVNKFNVDSQTLMLFQQTEEHPILLWLEDARLVQQMGYIHILSYRHQIANGIKLDLPLDQLHLKTQLRLLMMTSRITNQGDIRVILNLLDALVPPPE